MSNLYPFLISFSAGFIVTHIIMKGCKNKGGR